jgi:hypothetical protein
MGASKALGAEDVDPPEPGNHSGAVGMTPALASARTPSNGLELHWRSAAEFLYNGDGVDRSEFLRIIHG